MKSFLTSVVSVAALCAFADIQLSDLVEISSDTVVSEQVSGSGGYVIKNGAKLTLAHADNAFTGGVSIQNGYLEATASGAFGTGPIVLETSAATKSILLNAADGIFGNAITVKDVGGSEASPTICLLASATLTGVVSLDQGMSDLRNQSIAVKLGQSTSDTSVKLTFANQVLAGTGGILMLGWGQADFKAKVSCGDWRGMNLGNGNFSQTGTVRLYCPDNEIRRISMSYFQLRCEAAHVIDNMIYNLYYPAMKINGGFLFTRYPQDFGLLTTSSGTEIDWSDGDGYAAAIRNEDSTTLQEFRLTAKNTSSTSGRCHMRFYGPINLVMTNMTANGAKFYQGFAGRDQSQMTGRIEVNNNCQFRCLNGCRFSNVTNLLLRSGAEMTFEALSSLTTPVGNTFTSLQDLKLEGTSFIRVDTAKAVNPINSPEATLCMDSDSRIYLMPGVEMTVKRLFVNGEKIPAGDYTSENLEQLRHWSASYNGGVLHVLKGSIGMSIFVR